MHFETHALAVYAHHLLRAQIQLHTRKKRECTAGTRRKPQTHALERLLFAPRTKNGPAGI